jgi:phosphate-selective porin OprO and OprP
MQGKSLLLTTVAVVALVASTGAGLAKSDSSYSMAPPPATPAGPSNAELSARIDALEAELAAAEERRNADHGRLSTLEQNFNDTSWTFDYARPTVKSGDGRFTMAFRVRFQADFAGFSQDYKAGAANRDLASGAVIRRGYFGVEGKVFNDFAYEFRLNAGGTDGGSAGASGVPAAGEGDPLMNKAVITYTGIPHFHFNFGIIEPAFMFEGTTSSAQLIFLERPEIDNIAADSFGAGDSRRGIEVGWQHADLLWAGDSLAITAAFTGAKTGSQANHGNSGDEQTQVLGRVSDRLWTDGLGSNIAIGGSVADVLYSGTTGGAGGGAQQLRFRDRPEIRVDGTRLIDTGAINAKTGSMWAVDAGGNIGNFYLGAEYAEFQMDRQCSSPLTSAAAPTRCKTAGVLDTQKVYDHPNFSGWYVEGSWIITGETKGYTLTANNNETGGFQGPVPSAPFSLSGGSWGAWELAVRYSNTDLNWHQGITGTTSHLAGIDGGEERVVAVALNWYLNRNVRVMLDDNIVDVTKGAVGTPVVQHTADQNFNVFGVRLQFAN